MSTEKTSAYTHVPRVASFTVKTVKGKRIFSAVNKRAHKLARKAGKRTQVTAADLKAFKGYYKLRIYNEDGKLVSAKV